MMALRMDIEANLKTYLERRTPTGRYASFDYCFNYFQEHRESGRIGDLASPSRLQESCLHLGFYLASWGMFRGSAELLQRSAKFLEPVIKAIVSASTDIWGIDANAYDEKGIAAVRGVASHVKWAFPEGGSDILITKIMLGVFGCVPAFDGNFKVGFGASTFGPKALQ